MSTTHTLHLVYCESTRNRIPPLDALEGIPLSSFFEEATGGKLRLKTTRRQVADSLVNCTPTSIQRVIAEVLPADPERPTTEIALVFARSWHRSSADLLGLMFDRKGIEPALGEYLTSDGIPRQACAVFLDALAGKHKTPAQILHTAIHEIGHVYNLQHDLAQESFMGDATDAIGFNGEDCARLVKAAEGVWDYAPGGVAFGS